MKIEIASWRNIVPNVWSLHIRDAQSPMFFTNGKGATKEGALAIRHLGVPTVTVPMGVMADIGMPSWAAWRTVREAAACW